MTDADLPARVDDALASFLGDRRTQLEPLGPRVEPLLDAAAVAVAGGKRLRPAFCVAGWRVGGGAGVPDDVVRAASSLEWLQASALVHDDVIDDSATRRGRPAAHAAFTDAHRSSGSRGDAELFGVGAAVLLGDLMLSWADEMFRTSGFSPDELARATGFLDACKNEVVAGQFLDLAVQAGGGASLEDAMRVVRYKAAKYTVERPLHLGAALAGAGPRTIDALSAYAVPLGEAFQLRDDVLGVFGDPAVTGKPAGDDLREGKRTALVAHTASAARPAQRERLEAGLGNPALGPTDVADLRALMIDVGALARVEADITALEEQARDALDDDALRPHADLLADLAGRAVRRNA
ncbi:polyprenyl synthetase family protein [Mumia flava]|uniref:polyprenyl synthetase family protein n=1 Tax=Mumia flava TaxID=1348852 RepID=UPI001FE9E9E8|nr:polyprenyl synthetase family protein [Mumia flava]